MWCCTECFTSSYLRNIISSGSKNGDCDFCNSKGVSICDTSELTKFFVSILDLYVNDEAGDVIENQIHKDFTNKIFSDKVSSKRRDILKAIIDKDYQAYDHLFNSKVVVECLNNETNKDAVKPLQVSWSNFANEIKSTNRFHIQNALDLDKLKTLLSGYVKEIVNSKIFYRARLSSSLNGFPIEEMRNPSPDKAKAGRANPDGISYLYLSDQPRTTLYEVRSSLYDYVTIGEFELKDQIRVVNLRGDTYDPIYLAEQDQLEDFLIYRPFISKLELELSKPRRRSDNELDYLPTQYLSEFIKSIGFDGVEFQSSLYSNGYNLAIFKPDKFECIGVQVYEIQNIDLQHKILSK